MSVERELQIHLYVSDIFERIVAVPVYRKRRLLVKRDLQESCMFVERELLHRHISVSDSFERIVAVLVGVRERA